jgi:GAF domain
VVERGELTKALAEAVAGGGSEAALAVCRAVVEWLPMTGAAITLMTDRGGQEPVCATDAVAGRLHDLQFSLGEGPCVDSFDTGRPVLVADIADPADGRWPVFAAAADQAGARGMYVFPLAVGRARLGVLDCYRIAPGSLDRDELAGALRSVDAAVWALLDHAEPRAGESTGWAWFDGSPLTRAEVHQATGMLSVQAGLSLAAALARLRGAAFAADRPLDEMAADVVARRRRMSADGVWSPDLPPQNDRPDSTGPDAPGPATEENPS